MWYAFNNSVVFRRKHELRTHAPLTVDLTFEIITCFSSSDIQIIDVPKNECDDAFAYIPDLGAYGIVVYSFKTDKSWRVKHNFFYFDPVNGDYNVGGVNFQWTDGIFSLALGEQTEQGYYLHKYSNKTKTKLN